MSKRIKAGLMPVGCVLAGLLGSYAQAGVNEGSYEVLENGFGRFMVEINDPDDDGDSVPTVLDDVESVRIDDLIFDYSLDQNSPSGIYRQYQPGQPRLGEITLSLACGSKADFFDWRQVDGPFVFSISAVKMDGTIARRIHFKDTVVGTMDESISDDGRVCGKTVHLRPGMMTTETSNDNAGDVLDPGVYLDMGNGMTMDSPWNQWSGGGTITIQDNAYNAAKYRPTTPGHKSVEELKLTGPLKTGKRSVLSWVWGASDGVPAKRTVTVKEITKDGGAGKTVTFIDTFPTRYVFPVFSLDPTQPLTESLEVKAERVQLR